MRRMRVRKRSMSWRSMRRKSMTSRRFPISTGQLLEPGVDAANKGQGFFAEVTESQAAVTSHYSKLNNMVIKGANSFA
jgi:hypothetical protein